MKDRQDTLRLEKKSYKDYLFEDTELSAFWVLSWMLGDQFRHMQALATFHRLPRRIVMRSWENPAGNACADATGNKTEGYIRLGDQVSRRKKSGAGSFNNRHPGISSRFGVGNRSARSLPLLPQSTGSRRLL